MPQNDIENRMMEPPQIYVERTLAIVKPDAIDKAEEIEEIILQSGFTILQVGRATVQSHALGNVLIICVKN